LQQGTFITFEGGEGCGKTTHSKKIKKYLESKGHKVVLTHEPGGTALGRKIRGILLFRGSRLSPLSELMLFCADRAEHVNKVILPSLAQGKVVICDRFIDSTVAYQIYGRGLPEDLVRYLNAVSSYGLIPDITFLLDVAPEVGVKRAAKEKGGRDRFESEKMDFHGRIRAAYLDIAKASRSRVKVIDSQKGISSVESEIKSHLDRFLSGRGVA
jgi:dTMP kinase